MPRVQRLLTSDALVYLLLLGLSPAVPGADMTNDDHTQDELIGVDTATRAPPLPVPLPAATEAALDLAAAPDIDWWHAFHFGDHDEHVGYAHFTLSRRNETLLCVYDWCFDGGTYGLIGGYQRSRLELVAGLPKLIETLYESNDGRTVEEHRIVTDASGAASWQAEIIASADGSAPGKPVPLPTTAMLLDALQMQLACLMPRRIGACMHSCYADFDGTASEMALRVEGDEVLDLADSTHRHAWRFQHHHEQGPCMVSWVADDGTLLRTAFGPAYGEAWHELATRDAATAGVNPQIRVRLGGKPLSGR